MQDFFCINNANHGGTGLSGSTSDNDSYHGATRMRYVIVQTSVAIRNPDAP